MAEKNVDEMPSGHLDEKILVLEEMPVKGQSVGRTSVLTDSVRDLIKSGKKDGEVYNVELSEGGTLPSQSKKGKVKLLDVRQNDNPLTAFMRNLTAHLDAMDTKGNLKSIYVVSANKLDQFFERLHNRFVPQNNLALANNEFSVKKLKKEEQLINDGKMIDPAIVDWKKLESEFGVKADLLTKSGDMDKLLHFQQSDAVKVTLPPKPGHDEGFDTKARFSLTKDGNIRYTLFAPKVDLDRPFMGHSWSDQDKQTLMHDGNLGRPIELQKSNGEINSYYVSIDPQTNRLSLMREDQFKVPNKLGVVDLTPDQQKDLKDGKMVRIEGMRRVNANGVVVGNPYNTYIQVNADKRGIEFIVDPKKDFMQRYEEDRKYLKEEWETQHKFAGIPRYKYGKELTEDQRFALGYGKTLYLEGLKKKDGTTFSTYLQVNDKGVLRSYSSNPSLIDDKVNKFASKNEKKEEKSKKETLTTTVKKEVKTKKSRGPKL